ncbi:hypothetical protein DAI22_04g140500 [Oryza sativa Japonica Group]|nr:hypothetical protein DAI22_04g140500 [Oryza sativa Japonica Group]
MSDPPGRFGPRATVTTPRRALHGNATQEKRFAPRYGDDAARPSDATMGAQLLLLHYYSSTRATRSEAHKPTNQPGWAYCDSASIHRDPSLSLSLPPPLGAACLASCASCSSPPATATATAARCPKASKPKRPGRLPPPPTTTATTSPPPSPFSQSLRLSATSTSTSRSSRANRDLPDPATPPFSGEIHLREFRGCWRRRGRYRAGCG